MSASDPPTPDPQAFATSRFGAPAITRLRAAFDRSRNPMLLADDRRRWVAANAAASELLRTAGEELHWLTVDDFTPPNQRERLEQRWAAFLAGGEAEGWTQLYLPGRRVLPVEFSATANVLPGRHLSVFIPPERSAAEQADATATREAAWRVVEADEDGRRPLTAREQEVMALVAAGLQSSAMAERLFLSQETVKSHVANAMRKLGSHTRAHAVAIALVSGQISWKTE